MRFIRCGGVFIELFTEERIPLQMHSMLNFEHLRI